MKKIITAAIAAMCVCGNLIAEEDGNANNANDNEPKLTGAAAKAALKQQMKDNVKREENGDVIIKNLPDINASNAAEASDVGPTFYQFLTYVDKDLDFAYLTKSIERAAGNRKASNGGYLLRDLMKGIDKYLARNNMSLQKVGFGGNNIRLKIDDGMPILVWIRKTELFDTDFKDRTEKRATAASADEWKKALRKLEQKKLDKSGTTYMRALCIGYNKTTGEYLFTGMAKKDVWLTDKEADSLIWEAYILRF